MNKKIYKLLENEINTYDSQINDSYGSNGALFFIFDSFFQNLRAKTDVTKECGIKLESILIGNLPVGAFYIPDDSTNQIGVSFSFIFEEQRYFIKFLKYRDGDKVIHNIAIKSENNVKYSALFIYKYILYSALETSKLKGSYFSMPRNSFSWDIKTLENRTFDDIFLPSEITEDLKLYVKIFEKSGRILRYLKVGNPGVGKTESSIVLACLLKQAGVTIIKTSICDYLHEKVELANVLAPALIIFDDIDLSLGDRNKGAYSSLLGDFLDVLDGTDKLANNVGIIATTNAAHLLDLAAQRPGRFDKTLLFDNITKDNIKNIILKSLKNNFKIEGPETVLYTDNKIIDLFYDAGATGSNVYNNIKMLKLRFDTLDMKDVTVTTIMNAITTEIETIKKVRKISFLKEDLERSNSNIGFKRNSYDSDNDVLGEELCIPAVVRENEKLTKGGRKIGFR